MRRFYVDDNDNDDYEKIAVKTLLIDMFKICC